MKEHRLPKRYGYMYGLWLAEQKGWKRAFIDACLPNGERFNNVGLLGTGTWTREWEFASVEDEHDLVTEFEDMISVSSADGMNTTMTLYVRLKELK